MSPLEAGYDRSKLEDERAQVLQRPIPVPNSFSRSIHDRSRRMVGNALAKRRRIELPFEATIIRGYDKFFDVSKVPRTTVCRPVFVDKGFSLNY